MEVAIEFSDREAALDKAISEIEGDVFSDVLEGSWLNGWVLVAEWVSPDGNKHLSRTWSKDVSSWHMHGMLTFALDEPFWEGED